MEEGYWYQREDGKIKLWCSAIPAIGVAYVDFLTAAAEYKTAYSVQQLTELADVTSAPNAAVEELQSRFIEGQTRGLTEFVRRSEKIAASPDGRAIFIVRNHHVYEAKDGWGEWISSTGTGKRIVDAGNQLFLHG